MGQRTGAAVLLGGLLAVASGEDAMKVEYKPLSIAALSEFGMLQSGRYGNSARFSDEWVDHFGAFITQTAVLNEKLTFNIGLGGLFEFQKREVVRPDWGGTQYKNFFIGPTIADLQYRTAGPGNGEIGFGIGLFPYKYNPDASNLGEYLFRTGPYPTHIMTGGYAFVNNPRAYLQGFQGIFRAGNLSADLLVTTETSSPALYDLSLAGVLKYRVAGGLLDLGAGINAKRIVPIRPSKTQAKTPTNSYFTKGTPTGTREFTGQAGYYSEHANFYSAKAVEAGLAGRPADSVVFTGQAASWKADADSVRAWTRKVDGAGNPLPQPAYSYYTQAGTIFMASIALDPKVLFTSSIFGPQDLRIFAEAALLGWKNYPIYYERREHRIPVMAGFNFPGFGILDLISLQAEYFNSPFMNSYLSMGNENGATPTLPEGSDRDRSVVEYNDISTRDNISWSVLLKKELTQGINMSAQVARDHIRTVSIDSWFGPGLEPTEVLGTEKDWYWMLQFSFGI